MIFRWLTAISLLLLNDGGNGATILVYVCQMAKSHHIVFHPIIRELAARGHIVDYYTHVPMKNPPKKLNQILFPSTEKSMKIIDEMDRFGKSDMWVISNLYGSRSRRFTNPDFSNCHHHNVTKELLASNKKYDMVIGEFLFFQEDYTVLIHRFNALGVTLSSLADTSWLREFSGLPDNPAYMINFFSSFSDRMDFVQRVTNFLTWTISTGMNYYYTAWGLQQFADEKLTYEGWESRPSIMELCSNMALFLVNSHHSLGYSYPSAPHVKEILGTNIDEKVDPLPTDLQEFMDSAEHGVVYFSMGSLVSVKHLRKVNIYEPLLKVLSKLKQKVLWKWTSWSDEEIPKLQATNIKMSKWFPQQSILAHDKVRLIITHGGLGTSTESVYYGVPIIGIPVFGDQTRNIKLAETAGFGIKLHWKNVTEASLSWAVNEILNNPRYNQEVQRRSAIFKDRPMKPTQEAVYWIEYVLKYGRVLQPAASHLPFYQLYLLDILAFLLVVSLSTIFIVKKMFNCIRYKLFKTHKSDETKKNRPTAGKLESKKRK